MIPEYADIPFDGPPAEYGETSYRKRYVIIHNTSNDASDTTEADYAQRRTDGTSSHYYVDADSITQSLRTEYGANHVGSATGNRHGISYEITGANAKPRAWWMSNVAWPLLARQIARDCRKWSIRPALMSIEEMRDGKSTGIATHDMARRAWGGTTHTDPGPNFPMDYLISLVQIELGVMMAVDMEEFYAEVVRGRRTGDNALYWWLVAIATGEVPTSTPTGYDWSNMQPAPFPGLAQLGEQLTALRVAELATHAEITGLREDVRNLVAAGGVSEEVHERVMRRILRSVPE